jgi:hypothetical protein
LAATQLTKAKSKIKTGVDFINKPILENNNNSRKKCKLYLSKIIKGV